MLSIFKILLKVTNINSNNKGLSQKYMNSLHQNGVMETIAERNTKIKNIVNIHCNEAYSNVRKAI